MSWFDILLIISFAALVVLGVQRRIMGLIIGLGGLILFRPLLYVLNGSSYVALLLALIAGLLLGLASRFLLVRRIGQGRLFQVLGGVGGGLLGCLMIFAVVTSLPLGRNVNNQIIYPAASLPDSLNAAVRSSRLVNVGRDILLYPLLKSDPRLSGASGTIYNGLHQFFVVGQPWEGSQN